MMKCNLAPAEELFLLIFSSDDKFKTRYFFALCNHTFALNYAVSLIVFEAVASKRSLSYNAVILKRLSGNQLRTAGFIQCN